MNRDDLSPLSEDLQRLLMDERSAPSISDAMQSKIAARLATSLAAPPLPPEAGGGPGDAMSADLGGAAAGTASAAQWAPLSILAAKPLLLASLAFGIGAGAGVAGTVLYNENSAPTGALPVVQLAPADAGPIAMVSVDAAQRVIEPDAGAESESIQPPRVIERSERPGLKDQSLAAERSLLELSRTAITRGDAATALRELEAHKRAHRKGRLAEERDALWVQALVLAGDTEQARRMGQDFKNRYPQSLFLPVIDHVLAESP